MQKGLIHDVVFCCGRARAFRQMAACAGISGSFGPEYATPLTVVRFHRSKPFRCQKRYLKISIHRHLNQ